MATVTNDQTNPVARRPDTYSVDDIALILGVSKKTTYKLCDKDYFVSKRIGRAIRINRKSFDLWFNSNS